MKIDLSKLLKGLESLPHTPAPEPENVPPYVLTNILAPLKNDDCICFADLDFEILTACTVHCLKQRTGNTV